MSFFSSYSKSASAQMNHCYCSMVSGSFLHSLWYWVYILSPWQIFFQYICLNSESLSPLGVLSQTQGPVELGALQTLQPQQPMKISNPQLIFWEFVLSLKAQLRSNSPTRRAKPCETILQGGSAIGFYTVYTVSLSPVYSIFCKAQTNLGKDSGKHSVCCGLFGVRWTAAFPLLQRSFSYHMLQETSHI